MKLTRFMWFAFQAFMIFIVAFAFVVGLEIKRPDKDNTVLEALILGFATTNAGLLWTKAAAEKANEAVRQTASKTEETLNRQDQVLDQVHDKVNGGTTRLIEALKAEHDAALNALREEWKRDRHKIVQDLNAERLTAKADATELKEKATALAEAKAIIHDLTEKLSRCAENKEKPC